MRIASRWFAVLFVTLLAWAPLGAASDEMNEKVLEWRTMVGVFGPFLGAANPIHGVNGGGAPWVLDRAEGQLRSDGDLLIQVRGLVIPGRGNPAAFFLATVSCITVDPGGAVMIQNVRTTQAETTMIGNTVNGDAVIRAKVSLPHPCIAPIVFVTSPGGAWFAATGM